MLFWYGVVLSTSCLNNSLPLLQLFYGVDGLVPPAFVTACCDFFSADQQHLRIRTLSGSSTAPFSVPKISYSRRGRTLYKSCRISESTPRISRISATFILPNTWLTFNSDIEESESLKSIVFITFPVNCDKFSKTLGGAGVSQPYKKNSKKPTMLEKAGKKIAITTPVKQYKYLYQQLLRQR